MSKQKPSGNKEIVKATAPDEKEASTDTDPAVKAKPEGEKPDAKAEVKAEKKDQVKAESGQKPEVMPAAVKPEAKTKPPKPPKVSRGFPFFGVFNLLLIIGMATAAGYYWQIQQKAEQQKIQTIAALRAQLGGKADSSQLAERLAPLESGIGTTASQIGDLQQQQAALRDSAEKLFELYGRDESGWQLAEVEYLMRIAQHKLILENDFEGAAITLQAASDKIAAIADPGLLPVRVQISDEIAILKTRARPDLVGMTLLLSQLSRQIKALTPGYLPRIEATQDIAEVEDTVAIDQTITERVVSFISSQVSIKKDESPPTRTEALVVDIEQTLEDNLKLTRWTVLDRDNFQFQKLMQENLQLFKQYYDLDNAANHDFYTLLTELQKATVRPEKPNITGSLQLLKRIISKRENAPQQNENEGAENG